MKLGPSLAVALALGLGASSASGDTEDCLRAYEQAQRFRLQSKLIEARNELLICGQDTCSAVLRKDCVTWLAEVNEATPAIALQVRGADGCDRPQATAFVDGVLVPRGAEGRPIETNPGPHTVRVEVDGTMVEQTVVATAGDRRRVVTLASVSHPGTCGVVGPAPLTVAVPLVPARPEGARPVPALVYVLGGIGIAGLGVGAGFGIAGVSQKSTLDHCKGSCSDRDVDTMKRTFLVSDVSTGVGLVALGVATILYLTR